MLFSSVLPNDVDFNRYQGETGETVYLFTHSALGVLGRLSVIPHPNKVQVVWEPLHDYLQPFMELDFGQIYPFVAH